MNQDRIRYELVRSARAQRQFEKTWEYFCARYQWRNDPYARNGIRYNLLIPGRFIFQPSKVVGTVEFIPYDPNNPDSTVEGRNGLGLYKLEPVSRNAGRVWEIDKLCIHQDYQRKGYFQVFMSIFMEHAVRHQAKIFVAFIEEKFYRMLRILYGLDVVAVGPACDGPTTRLIPILFDVEGILNNDEKLRAVLHSG